MSGETILKLGTPKTLEANGESIANNTLAQADDASYRVASDGAYYPDAKFVISVTFGPAPTEGTTLALYARPLYIDGTNNAEVPETTRPTVFIGTFSVNNVTTAASTGTGFRLTKRGKYRCECGEIKLGQSCVPHSQGDSHD